MLDGRILVLWTATHRTKARRHHVKNCADPPLEGGPNNAHRFAGRCKSQSINIRYSFACASSRPTTPSIALETSVW